jgi:ferric-dicitrate binding protein FerR (iron transport regulator)
MQKEYKKWREREKDNRQVWKRSRKGRNKLKGASDTAPLFPHMCSVEASCEVEMRRST